MDNQGEQIPPDYYFDYITIGGNDVKYYKDPETGAVYRMEPTARERTTESAADRLRKGPPSENQLNRIRQLKEMPEFAPHLEWLLQAISGERSMLKTFGQAGIIIQEMKRKIRAAGGKTP